jgi:hypothetical protein
MYKNLEAKDPQLFSQLEEVRRLREYIDMTKAIEERDKKASLGGSIKKVIT